MKISIIFLLLLGLHLYRFGDIHQFSLYNTSKTIIIKRVREARTFNRKVRFGHGVAKSSLAKNERQYLNTKRILSHQQ